MNSLHKDGGPQKGNYGTHPDHVNRRSVSHSRTSGPDITQSRCPPRVLGKERLEGQAPPSVYPVDSPYSVSPVRESCLPRTGVRTPGSPLLHGRYSPFDRLPPLQVPPGTHPHLRGHVFDPDRNVLVVCPPLPPYCLPVLLGPPLSIQVIEIVPLPKCPYIYICV